MDGDSAFWSPGAVMAAQGGRSGLNVSIFPGDSPASLFSSLRGVCVCVCVCSQVQVCATLWTAAPQAPLAMGSSRQEHWGGLPCPPPGDLPDPGMDPVSLESPALAGGFFTSAPPGEPLGCLRWPFKKNVSHLSVAWTFQKDGTHLLSWEGFPDCMWGA